MTLPSSLKTFLKSFNSKRFLINASRYKQSTISLDFQTSLQFRVPNPSRIFSYFMTLSYYVSFSDVILKKVLLKGYSTGYWFAVWYRYVKIIFRILVMQNKIWYILLFFNNNDVIVRSFINVILKFTKPILEIHFHTSYHDILNGYTSKIYLVIVP